MKYQVGDYVRIREWDDMVEEFGYLHDLNYIKVPFNFTEPMRPLCGQVYKIYAFNKSRTQEWAGNISYSLEYRNEPFHYHFSEEMFEPVLKNVSKDVNNVAGKLLAE